MKKPWGRTIFICFNVYLISIECLDMNVNLGAPYEIAIKRIIEKGYAGSQTEVIRQAILAYEHMIEEEELMLVHKAAETEMAELEACKVKTHSLQEIKKILAPGH